ncbi:MAG: hypothetical protein NVS3B1_05910 [Marmoricola sp.]
MSSPNEPQKREPVNLEVGGSSPEQAAGDAMDLLFPERGLRASAAGPDLTGVAGTVLMAELGARAAAVLAGDNGALATAAGALATLARLLPDVR